MSITRRDLIVILSVLAVVSIVGALTHFVAPGWATLLTVLSALAAVLMVVLDTYRRTQGTLAECHHEPGENYRQTESLFSLFALLRLEAPLPPLRGAAVSPDFAAALLGLIRNIHPLSILEAGSGVSTLIAGYGLKASGTGHLTSIEEDAAFADLTRRRVIEHGLESFVTVVHAPLKQTRVGGQELPWYDVDSIRAIEKIDLLIVDGPRQDRRPTKHVRYPALPLLFGRLSERSALIVDDCHRPDEQEIVERWLREFPDFQAERGAGEKHHVILRRRAAIA